MHRMRIDKSETKMLLNKYNSEFIVSCHAFKGSTLIIESCLGMLNNSLISFIFKQLH